MKLYTDCQICSIYVCRTTLSRISMYIGTKHYNRQAKLLQKCSWKDFTSQNYRIQVSVQLQTVSALYDQETNRNSGQSTFQRLKTSGWLHIDQTMRAQNIRAWKETVEREGASKSRKWKKAYVERKVGECRQRETMFKRRQRQFHP